MCNYSGNALGCSSAEYFDALGLIAGQCGIDVAGWVGINDWAKSYGVDNNGVSQCWQTLPTLPAHLVLGFGAGMS